MSAAIARLKRGVRASIAGNGGVDGAAATVDRRRSIVGDWMNLQNPAFPGVDRALALDEVSIAEGRDPEIIRAYARELGGVFVMLPDSLADSDSLPGMVMELMGRLGDISEEMRAAQRNDGQIDAAEARLLLDLHHRHDEVSAQLRLALTHLAQGSAGRTSTAVSGEN